MKTNGNKLFVYYIFIRVIKGKKCQRVLCHNFLRTVRCTLWIICEILSKNAQNCCLDQRIRVVMHRAFEIISILYKYFYGKTIEFERIVVKSNCQITKLETELCFSFILWQQATINVLWGWSLVQFLLLIALCFYDVMM